MYFIRRYFCKIKNSQNLFYIFYNLLQFGKIANILRDKLSRKKDRIREFVFSSESFFNKVLFPLISQGSGRTWSLTSQHNTHRYQGTRGNVQTERPPTVQIAVVQQTQIHHLCS